MSDVVQVGAVSLELAGHYRVRSNSRGARGDVGGHQEGVDVERLQRCTNAAGRTQIASKNAWSTVLFSQAINLQR